MLVALKYEMDPQPKSTPLTLPIMYVLPEPSTTTAFAFSAYDCVLLPHAMSATLLPSLDSRTRNGLSYAVVVSVVVAFSMIEPLNSPTRNAAPPFCSVVVTAIASPPRPIPGKTPPKATSVPIGFSSIRKGLGTVAFGCGPPPKSRMPDALPTSMTSPSPSTATASACWLDPLPKAAAQT